MTARAVMANLKLKYVKSYTDAKGVRRHYFRRKGNPGGPLPGAVGSAEFMEAYSGFMSTRPKFDGKKPGSFGRIITDYYQTADFSNLSTNSRALYKAALEPLAKRYGHNAVNAITEDRVVDMIEKIGERAPQMANLTRSVLLKALSVAHRRKWIPRKITGEGITEYRGGEHRAWTLDEMNAFEKRWPVGTRERLAYALLLYTGQRGGDVVAMNRRDAMAGYFSLTQEKTGEEMRLPIAQPLLDAIKAVPANGLTVIGDRHGRPIQRRTLTKMLKAACAAAGLPKDCVPHGLRKAILVRLAEAGASAKELAAISGHRSTKLLDHYTRAANQAVLASNAMARLTPKKRT